MYKDALCLKKICQEFDFFQVGAKIQCNSSREGEKSLKRELSASEKARLRMHWRHLNAVLRVESFERC